MGLTTMTATICGVEGPNRIPRSSPCASSFDAICSRACCWHRGVPLILAGDEVGNSQNGNNNAYCQTIQSVGSMVRPRPQGEDMTELVAQLTSLRRAYPQLRTRRFVEGRRPDGSFGVLWLTPQATEMTRPTGIFREGRFLSYVLGPVEAGQSPLFMVLNAAAQEIEFTFPALPEYKPLGCPGLDTGNRMEAARNTWPVRRRWLLAQCAGVLR